MTESFLAEKAPKAGTLAEITFEVVDENADKDTLEAAIRFTGEAFNENGESVPRPAFEKGADTIRAADMISANTLFNFITARRI